MKKIVAIRLQKMPIAHVTPSPVSAGFRARARDPKPLIAVSPASKTGFTTPAKSCWMIVRFLPDEHDVDSVIHADGEHQTE